MNIGIIGCGRVAAFHVFAYSYIKNANIVAISDLNLKTARAFAAKYGIKKVFTDHKDLCETKDLDFVDICTPVSTHVNIACDVAESGHNVLIEKPMALTTAECERMIDAAKRNGVKLSVCHNQKFIPNIMKAKAMVDSGDYDLASFRASIQESAELIGAPKWVLTPAQKGGLWESGCHAAYLQLLFLKDIKEVYAVGSKIKNPVYDDLSVLLRTSDQSHGIIELSWIAKQVEITYELASSDGRKTRILNYNLLEEQAADRPKHVWSGLYVDARRSMKKWVKPAIDGVTKGKIVYCLPHLNLINRYIESLENDSPLPVTPEEGKNAIKLLECIEESLDTHKIVPMK